MATKVTQVIKSWIKLGKSSDSRVNFRSLQSFLRPSEPEKQKIELGIQIAVLPILICRFRWFSDDSAVVSAVVEVLKNGYDSSTDWDKYCAGCS